MKKIGILGSGVVAKTLGNGFLKHGYEVMLGSRNLDKLKDWQAQTGGKGKIGSFSEVTQFADIVVLATKGHGASSAVDLAGLQNLAGKTVIDTTNPIDEPRPPDNGVLHFYTTLDDSQMERLQRQAPDAHFVKAFSIVGNTFMVDPNFPGGKPTMFICGNDASAKQEVVEILHQFGWEIADMGKVEAARAIEPLCILWCIPGFLANQWTHAFKLLKM